MAAAKNIYSVHDDDGRITMSNKVFDDENGAYGRILADREMQFLNHAGKSYARVDEQFVWNGELSSRPMMPVRIDKTEFPAGEQYGTKVRGIPRDALITIVATGIPTPIFQDRFSGRILDLTAPVPGVYLLTVSKWPYRDWSCILSITA